MGTHRVLFLNYRQTECGFVGKVPLPSDYVLACRFLHCSIIDRTGTLDQGFDYAVLDPIPPRAADGVDFADLCDTIGAEIVNEAIETQQEIGVLWSGGIDSTTALIAIMKAAAARGCGDRVRVMLSLDSVQEYPRFFLRHVNGKYGMQAVTHPISRFLGAAMLTVTGEHGDQLFGSHLLESYVRRGVGGVDYREILPLVLMERLLSVRGAYRVRSYLEPAIEAAPVPIRTLFDCLWWLNFALKWQEVTLRLAAFRGEQARAVYGSLRHFFRDERFQAWALGNAGGRCVPVWAHYKAEAKRYILDYTGDHAYYRTKEKEDSLKNVMVSPANPNGYRILMREDFRPVINPVEPMEEAYGHSLRDRLRRRAVGSEPLGW